MRPRLPHLRHRSALRLLRSMAACGLLSGLVALPGVASPKTAALLVAQWDAPRQRLEPGPPMPESIEPLRPAPPRIETLPADDTQKLTAPPARRVEPLLPADTGDQQAVQREIQRLMQTAYAGGAYGITAASAHAAWLLGLIHLHGSGVRVDPALAQQWFNRAARKGLEPWAYAGQAWCGLEGCAGAPDLAAAQQAIARLRAAQPARADFLAWLLASRQSPSPAAQPALAQAREASLPELALLERAATAGDVQANIELGLQAFADQQPERAAQFFRRAAPRSSAAAANLREVESQQQKGAARSEAPRAAGTSADAASALAQARKYHRGDGVPANFAEAIRFYRLADQRGSAEARRMLALIASRPSPDGGFNVQWMQQLANADLDAPIATLGSSVSAHALQREPSPLFDLLPPVWQRRVMPLGR